MCTPAGDVQRTYENSVVPKDDGCNTFGPTKDYFVRTYASAITRATAVSASEDIMDEAEADAVFRGA